MKYIKKPKQHAVKKTPESTEATFPMRINKYLAFKNHSTRRGADVLVEKGKVFINGKLAQLGDKVTESDRVEVRHRGPAPKYAYFAFHKPASMNTHQEPTGEDDIVSSLPEDMQALKLFPLGRLDKDSSGLIILTNDGRVTDRLLNPKYDHEKTYEVRTKKPLRPNFKEKMETGVDIEGYITKECRVEILGARAFRVTLKEGKTHQIRRMVAALFNEVADLRRTRVLNISLSNLPPRAYREIKDAERKEFLQALGLE